MGTAARRPGGRPLRLLASALCDHAGESASGKLDLQGPDVPLLLSLLYTNTWMQLPVGGVRYGIMCAEDGVVLDDGVTGRLADEHYLMTTTSSGPGP